MPKNFSAPLLRVPLTVIADVLAQFDTIQQLGPAILSHSLFRDALRNYSHSITTQILQRQVPPNVLPFAYALLESSKIRAGGGSNQAIRDGLDQLDNWTPASSTGPFTTNLIPSSLAGCAFISKNHTAIDSLSRSLEMEARPLAARRLRAKASPNMSAAEQFRLYRAFYRFQLMCNLFCYSFVIRNGSLVSREPLTRNKATKKRFFSAFSPWVNEELTCVYMYLSRKLEQAYKDVRTHALNSGDPKHSWIKNMDYNALVQWDLCRGLPFLASIAKATYQERLSLIQIRIFQFLNPDHGPYWQLRFMRLDERSIGLLGLDDADTRLRDYTEEQLRLLERHQEQNIAKTSSFRAWLYSHLDEPISRALCNPRDQNLLEFGYVLWDLSGRIPKQSLRKKYADVRAQKRAFAV